MFCDFFYVLNVCESLGILVMEAANNTCEETSFAILENQMVRMHPSRAFLDVVVDTSSLREGLTRLVWHSIIFLAEGNELFHRCTIS